MVKQINSSNNSTNKGTYLKRRGKRTVVGLTVRAKSEERSLASRGGLPCHTLGGPKPLHAKSGEGEQCGKHRLAPPAAHCCGQLQHRAQGPTVLPLSPSTL